MSENNNARSLTDSEKEKLEKDGTLVTTYKQQKLELEAQKNWDLFYKRNETRFFRDRHWTKREFYELVNDRGQNERSCLLEVGCGVGNFIFPLIEEGTNFFIYACDFSPRAVEFVKKNPLYSEDKCKAFQCDITKDDLSSEIPAENIDIVSLVFVLSAIHPDKMSLALDNIFKVLKPGGIVLFRDYGLFDQAMLRFKPGHKLMENFYVRQDGTRAYYFSEEYTANLFSKSGFEVVDNSYVQRKTVNVKEGIDVPRIFVQGKFRKPQLDKILQQT